MRMITKNFSLEWRLWMTLKENSKQYLFNHKILALTLISSRTLGHHSEEQGKLHLISLKQLEQYHSLSHHLQELKNYLQIL